MRDTTDEDVSRYNRMRWPGGLVIVIVGVIFLITGVFSAGFRASPLWPFMPVMIVLVGLLVLGGFGRFARKHGVGHYSNEEGK
ncbi:MAG: hypothetical protein ACJ71T_02515 [Actinomycetales bacterium]